MRSFIDVIRETAAWTARLRDASLAGFHTGMILYHGTSEQFDTFDRLFARTASHIYLAPDPATASYYGSNVFACVIKGRLADLTHEGDPRVVAKLAKQFASRFDDHVRGDSELADLAATLARPIMARDPEMTEQEAVWEAEDTQPYRDALVRVTTQYAADYLLSGEMYNYDYRGNFQDEVLSEVFALGYDAVRIVDASHSGESISIVVNQADHVMIVGRADEA